MPSYTEEELLSIGEYLKKKKIELRKVRYGRGEEYSEEALKRRFNQSGGGIIRHIFPESKYRIDSTARMQSVAVNKILENKHLLARHIFNPLTIEEDATMR